MFLAAAAYFQSRFATSPLLLSYFPSAIISISSSTNFLAMIPLAHFQRHASYPFRIIVSLSLNIVAFTFLALSTAFFLSVPPGIYFTFLMFIVFTTAFSSALTQNGTYAYAAGFGRTEYMQGIMAGQAVAGILPCVAQIISVLSSGSSENSAFIYFLTATGISTLALGAFLILVRIGNKQEIKKIPYVNEEEEEADDESEDRSTPQRKHVSMWTLFLKLRWLALAVSICFIITMYFPIFTQKIDSVYPSTPIPRLLQPPVFIPLAFLVWNTGDLVGRLLALIPTPLTSSSPMTLFLLSILRIIFIPLYLLCNIRGRGAVINSDLFYLIIVQLPFGVSNGWLASKCMMEAGRWVEEGEREAAGGFMGLMLCAGLSVGSFLSFFAA